MNAFKASAMAAIFAGGLGVPAGSLPFSNDTRGAAPALVDKCPGLCRASRLPAKISKNPRAALPQCGSERTDSRLHCRVRSI